MFGLLAGQPFFGMAFFADVFDNADHHLRRAIRRAGQRIGQTAPEYAAIFADKTLFDAEGIDLAGEKLPELLGVHALIFGIDQAGNGRMLQLFSGVTEHAQHCRVETLARHQMIEAYLIQR